MSGPGPAVLIMARAPRDGEVRRALEPLLGREGCLELQAALIAHAAAWAHQVSPGPVHVAHDPPDAGAELRRLVGPDAVMFPQNGEGIAGRLADASARVLARAGGPVLIVWPDLPRFRTAHASGRARRPQRRLRRGARARRSTAACTSSGLPDPSPSCLRCPSRRGVTT